MSEENIPQNVDPFRFADNAIQMQGRLSVKDMARLCESLCKDSGEVAVKFEFGKDEQGIRFIVGQISSDLQLQCQRCLEPFTYEVNSKLWLAIVHTEEEADKLPPGYDSIVINDEKLIIKDMVEDELIINLPVVPMHNPEDCKVTLPLIIKLDQETSVEKESPFKVIEFLRTKRDEK